MRYAVTTPLTPREALEQALADFGPGGLGLQITSQTNLSLGFQGGGVCQPQTNHDRNLLEHNVFCDSAGVFRSAS